MEGLVTLEHCGQWALCSWHHGLYTRALDHEATLASAPSSFVPLHVSVCLRRWWSSSHAQSIANPLLFLSSVGLVAKHTFLEGVGTGWARVLALWVLPYRLRSGLSSIPLKKVPLAIMFHWLFGELNGAAWSTSPAFWLLLRHHKTALSFQQLSKRVASLLKSISLLKSLRLHL